MHYLALVVDKILYSKCRRQYLMTCAEMIKLAAWQRQHGYAQTVELVVLDRRICAERAAELRIEVVVDALAVAL